MKHLLIIIFVFGLSLHGMCQSDTADQYSSAFIEGFDDSYRGTESIRAMFYNLENLFDIYDDTLKNDESFLPEGDHHWGSYKYYQKI